jgi:molybdopterin synthase catalytic subunit
LTPPDFSGDAGAVVDFYGVVRELEGEMQITGIDYEAHGEMARHQLELIANEAGRRFPIQHLTLHHRVGFVPAAEPSLFLRVSAERRKAAFEAAQWLIDELKARVPIWKHPAA